jgi:hypothetical protein
VFECVSANKPTGFVGVNNAPVGFLVFRVIAVDVIGDFIDCVKFAVDAKDVQDGLTVSAD